MLTERVMPGRHTTALSSCSEEKMLPANYFLSIDFKNVQISVSIRSTGISPGENKNENFNIHK